MHVDGCWELGMSSPLVRLLTGCFGPVSERCLTPLQLIQVISTQAVGRRLSSSECPPTKAMICACMRDGCACITSTSVNGFLKEGPRCLTCTHHCKPVPACMCPFLL